jgi:DNA-binding winged helix-turn-helix (wHTH) protein/tetratricopeptide (TPR) repeat protein/TolB-like protein
MASERPGVTSERRIRDERGPMGAGGDDGRPARLTFGRFVMEPESGRLLAGEQVVPLPPRPFETLLYLARNPGRVVTKAELMERLWPDTFVTDDVLVQCVVDIRRALGDHAREPQFVRTVPRRGYEFVAAVGQEPAGPASAVPAAPSPPRAPRLAWRRWHAAAAAALLVAGGGLWLSLRGDGDGGPALAMEPGSLVVMPMSVDEPSEESAWLRHGLPEMIRGQLGQTPGVRVVARHRLASALAAAGSEEAAPSPQVAERVARGLRAEKLVTGSFVRVEDRFVLTAQVLDVPSGRIQGTASVRGGYPAELLDSVDELCLKLIHHLGPAETTRGRIWKPAGLATRSVEASRQYVEALVSFARGGKAGAEEAEGRLDEALALDPTFAQAYVKKAEIQQWRRSWGYGEADPEPAVRAAARLVKELPDRERLLVQSFESLVVREQPALALRDWNALLQFYPTYAQEVGVPGLVADTFLRQGRWDELIVVGEGHVHSPSLPEAERARLSSLLAVAFRRKGEFERALEHARRAVDLWPTQEGPEYLRQRTALGRIGLEAGRRDEALAAFRTVARAPEADATNVTDAAWGLYMAGQPAEAGTLVERALSMDPSYGNAHHLAGWLQLAAGRYAAAGRSFETAWERTPRAFGNPHQGAVSGDLAALYYAGVSWQALGDQERAVHSFERLVEHCRRLLASTRDPQAVGPSWQAANYLARASSRLGLPAREPPPLTGDDTTYFVQSARLHAIEGRDAQALRALARGLALGHGEHQHIADDPDFASLRDNEEFRRVTRSAPSRMANRSP